MRHKKTIAQIVAPTVALGIATILPTPTRPLDSTTFAVGDSITAGYLIPNPARTYPQVLGDRLYGRDHTALHVVGHGGQCLVAPNCLYPTPLVDTWQTEVLDAAPGPRVVVLLIGTNDIGFVDNATMEAAYQTLVTSANAKNIRVIVGTIPPRTQAQWPSWGAQRPALNTWIKATFPYVADFDAALAGPDYYARGSEMDDDGLHPNMDGAANLGYAVPLNLFTG